jgi:hypothetical protein
MGLVDVDYRSWYGHAFDDQGATRVAQLSDSAGRRYDMMTFADARSIKGHTAEARLKSLEIMEDVLVFAIPEEVPRESIEYFRLELPAVAFGGQGSYRFEIPRHWIEGFE